MNARERFISTINRKEPDRPPLYATLTPQVARKLSDHLGLLYEEPLDSLLSTRISHMELLTGLGNDAAGIAACAPSGHPTKQYGNGISSNEWGMVFKSMGLYNEFYKFPLASTETIDDVEKYPFPDPVAKSRFREAEKAISRFQSEYGIIGDLETSIFETAWYLTGLEKLLTDLLTEPPYLDRLLDVIMDINLKTGCKLIDMGIDMIWAGDDFGSQHGMLIDPETWRKFFKPRMKYMFDAFRRQNPDIKIAWHTCGSVIPIIPDLIEIGLDILNPIQPEAKGMDPVFLKREFGKDLIFFGGVSVQDLLPQADPDTIKDEVRKLVSILGEKGGYIIAPAHNIQDDTPIENILAFFDAVKTL